MNKSALKSHSAALFTVFIWGITFVCTKHLIKSFTSLEILFVRYAVAYIVLWALCPKTMRVQSKKEELYIFVAAMTGTALYQFLENLSVSYTSPSSVAFITATAPLFTAVLAHKYLHETLNAKIIVGMIVSIVGVFIICFGDSTTIETGLVGDIIIFLSIWMWAVYSVVIKKLARYGHPQFLITRRMFFYSLIVMLPFILLDNHKLDVVALCEPVSIMNILFLGVFASAICFATWNHSVISLGATTTSKYLFISPIITLIAQSFYDRTGIGAMALFGMFITLLGLAVSEFDFKKNK